MDAGRQRLARLFREQAEGCKRLGSPFYAGLIARAADDIESGGAVAEVLAGHEDDPGPSALALRLGGAIHRLVLEGRVPQLSLYYPSVGGVADAAAAWPEFRRTIVEHMPEIRRMLTSPPQTNEVGRSAVLIGALLHLTKTTELPIRLLEVGASAGLNLLPDQYRYDISVGLTLGKADSPVVLSRPWAPGGKQPPTDVTVSIVERRGCDIDPVDPRLAADQLRLASYVWPDQPERLDRLHAALEIAQSVPAPVEQSSAADFLRRELSAASPGVLTVVWHSVVWQYIPPDERSEVERLMTEAAAQATTAAPLAHVSFEPRRVAGANRFAFLATLATWPAGEQRVVAEGEGHGPPVRWL